MRIGRPAGKLDVKEGGVRRAVRNAMRRVDLAMKISSMLIGRAADGNLLEIGVLDLDGEHPVVIHAMELSREFYGIL